MSRACLYTTYLYIILNNYLSFKISMFKVFLVLFVCADVFCKNAWLQAPGVTHSVQIQYSMDDMPEKEWGTAVPLLICKWNGFTVLVLIAILDDSVIWK